jgi:hypothetical protein
MCAEYIKSVRPDVRDARVSVAMPWPPRSTDHDVVVDPWRGIRIAY